MKLVEPKVTIVDHFVPTELVRKIELAARTCYQSNDDKKITDPEKFISNIIKKGHTSVIEHASISFRVVSDRGVVYELIRHRLGSYSQESTRYVKYDNDVQFIRHINEPLQGVICEINKRCEEDYNRLLSVGALPQIARQALNNGVKTEIYVTMNIRELRHFFSLRADKAAHPYMKEIAIPFLIKMKKLLPCLFEDIPYDEKFYEERLKGFVDDMVTFDCEYDLSKWTHDDECHFERLELIEE